MKLLRHLLASLAFVAVSAQANTISTTVLVDNSPVTDSVQWINFNVTDAGFFDIYATSTGNPNLNDPFILLFSGITPSQGSFIVGNDDISLFNTNSGIFNRNLGIGNYVLAVSNYELTIAEAVSRSNPGVTNDTEGYVRITLDGGRNADAAFGHTNPSAVPVPAAAWLFGSALMGFAGFRRKSV